MPLIAIDRSEIHPGKLDELKASFEHLATFVQEHEPRIIAYVVSFDEDGRTVTVLQVHPDSASMENHMRVAADEFAAFADLLQLRSMEVYGEPSPTLLELIRRKVDLLGSATVAVHPGTAGFARTAPDRAGVAAVTRPRPSGPELSRDLGA